MTTATEIRADVANDEQIHQHVLAELKWDARVKPSEIAWLSKTGSLR